MKMTSSRPYLLRAMYDWIVDNGLTPYLLVDAMQENVSVPTEHVKDGQIVLNISPSAVLDLSMTDDGVMFNARFSGIPTDIYAPVSALLGVYARENGQGMLFEPEDAPDPEPTDPDDGKGFKAEVVKSAPEKNQGKSASSRPALKVVK